MYSGVTHRSFSREYTGPQAIAEANAVFSQLRAALEERCGPGKPVKGTNGAETAILSYLYPHKCPQVRVDLRGTLWRDQGKGEVALCIGYVGETSAHLPPLEELAKSHSLNP